MLFNILPTLLEISMVAAILLAKYSVWYAIVTFVALLIYVAFTLLITEWRLSFVRTKNEMDSKANTRAIDSLINYETVKYFGNEDYEARRYDENMQVWERAAVKNQTSLAVLNFGQSAIIAAGVNILMNMASREVTRGSMTLGDLVLVNAFLIQMFIPLNFLGFVYREIRNSLADMERMFNLLNQHPEVKDPPGGADLIVGDGEVRFEHVDFGYDSNRQILFDVTHGRIAIQNQDIRDVTQKSLRAAIGIVPQDTVLFNDSIYYNIAYAKPEASREEALQAARLAHIHNFIESLPDGYDTLVGERGLKLSGGEKQRVAIARTVLKDPKILIFDEATSALDSKSEQAILDALREVAEHHTTLVIAHRLSTIIDADQILVMDQGRIVERGSHRELLDKGKVYAHMWALQQEERRKVSGAAANAMPGMAWP